MQTQELAAGPELDALIAVQILGWRWVPYPWYDGTIKQYLQAPDGDPPHGDDFYVFDDDTRITDWNFGGWSDTWDGAGEVVEHLYNAPKPVGYSFELHLSNRYKGPWRCQVIGPTYAYQVWGEAVAETAPLAICRAALLAIQAPNARPAQLK